MTEANRAYDRGREQGRAETEHQMRAEIARLTAVLQYISSLDDDGAAPVLARRALEPKP